MREGWMRFGAGKAHFMQQEKDNHYHSPCGLSATIPEYLWNKEELTEKHPIKVACKICLRKLPQSEFALKNHQEIEK